MKVGVIEGSFAFNGFRGLMGTELPETVQARCYTDLGMFTSDLADCAHAEFGSEHGTMVSEAVMDIAPGATLYIASPGSRGDLHNAVDWMVSEGVSVINYSISWIYDGPGDGTSPDEFSPLKAVDRAVNDGIVWTNSSGNYAQRTWFGPASDPDGDRFISFYGPYEANGMLLQAGDRGFVQLRWEDDWGGANRNLDIYLLNAITRQVLLSSTDPQSGSPGEYPLEGFGFRAPARTPVFIVVYHRSGSAPAWIQLQVRGAGLPHLEYRTSNGSVVNPAESNNPGMLAVGAAHWDN